MNVRSAGKSRAAGPAMAAAVVLCTVGLLCWPQTVFDGITDGFRLAFLKVIPAVFPMMVLSSVALYSPASEWLGILCRPFTRALGIREHAAATVLLLGWLGGFAVLAQGIAGLLENGKLDRHEAQLLLCAGMNVGPPFIVLTVGHGLLHSEGMGIQLLFSIYIGNYSAALLLHLLTAKKYLREAAPRRQREPRQTVQSVPPQGGFVNAVRSACNAGCQLCCYIALFSLLCRMARRILPPTAADLLCAVLEVTNGVQAVLRRPTGREWLLLATLLWTGLSIQMQAKALLPGGISWKPFYISRLPALAVGLFCYSQSARWFPPVVSVSTGGVRISRFPWHIWCTFLLLVLAFLEECTPKKAFTKQAE